MPKLLSAITKKKIVGLRRRGRSIPEISRTLAIPRSTVLRYAKDVPILPQFLDRWKERRNASKYISERAWHAANDFASHLVGGLSRKERILVVSALYWAEGNKKDLSFTNTDPGMIAVFMDILRDEFHIQQSDFKISIRVYEDLEREECLRFWSTITKINLQNNVSINVLRGKKAGKLRFGMCRVRIRRGGLILKTISAINRRIVALISPHSSTDRTRHS